jgi:hydroxyacyl-ACP dehydratase HTD2-like protein with hotdog domain
MAAPHPAPAQGASGFLRSRQIPTREHTYSALELFLFSAATWNPHRVHYDQDYTRGVAGEPELLVQGPLQAAHMFQFLREILAEEVSIFALEYRHRAVLHAGDPVRIGGRLVAGGPAAATVEMWVESSRSGQRTTTGLAHLRRTVTHRQAVPPASIDAQEGA